MVGVGNVALSRLKAHLVSWLNVTRCDSSKVASVVYSFIAL